MVLTQAVKKDHTQFVWTQNLLLLTHNEIQHIVCGLCVFLLSHFEKSYIVNGLYICFSCFTVRCYIWFMCHLFVSYIPFQKITYSLWAVCLLLLCHTWRSHIVCGLYVCCSCVTLGGHIQFLQAVYIILVLTFPLFSPAVINILKLVYFTLKN